MNAYFFFFVSYFGRQINFFIVQWFPLWDPDCKITLLLDHALRPVQEVADPWYTGDFDAAWNDILEGCEGLLAELTASDAE